MDSVHELRLAAHRRKGEASAERLPRHEQVGLHLEVLDRPDATGPAAAALHFVGDVHDAVLLAELPQASDELAWHRDEAAFALHGLEDDARDRLRIDVLLEEQLEAGESVFRRHAAV